MGHKLTEKQRLQQEELKAAGNKTDVNAAQTQSGSTGGDTAKNAAPEPAGTVPADTTTGTTTTPATGSTTRTR